MKVHFGFEEWKSGDGSVASLGNYDGVHVGHKAILGQVVARAQSLSIPSVAVTFDPVPKKILYPDSAPLMIQTLEQRLQKMETCGLDHAIVVRFDHAFARLSPQDFVLDYLVARLRIKGFVVGENFSFGYQKSGNIRLLRELGGQYGFVVEAIPQVRIRGERVSSTLIRQCVREGKVEEANAYLGAPFTLSGTVVEGEKLGGKLGIPTANLAVQNELLPANGVYVGRAIFSGSKLPAVTNVGIRPTVGGRKLTVEAHILEYSGNLYGREMQLEFLQKLREEKKFGGIDELKAQIHSDIESTRRYFVTNL
jgi:riboflavin kinase/FMN adenylyltransferase